MRKTEFANGEYYHVYNRGVDKRKIFSGNKDYERFLIYLVLMNVRKGRVMTDWRDYKKANPQAKLAKFQELSSWKEEDEMIDVIAFCLNPNHYHLILKQKKDKGIENFMHKIGTGYTNYFNKKHSRSGSLFQGTFKSIHIDSNEYLLYLSAYVNKNNFIHGYGQNKEWPYSSLPDYLEKRKDGIVKKDVVLKQFKNTDEYKMFIDKNALYMKEKKELEKYLIE